MDAQRPAPHEFADVYGRYVETVPDGPIVDFLEDQRSTGVSLLGTVPADREGFRYAPEKWSVREVVGHVVDSERMFAMRALAFARGDEARLPSFDEDDYAAASGADARPLSDLTREFDAVRQSNVLLFQGFEPEAWDRRGIANEREFSVRSLAWIIAGHAKHHFAVLEERYL